MTGFFFKKTFRVNGPDRLSIDRLADRLYPAILASAAYSFHAGPIAAWRLWRVFRLVGANGQHAARLDVELQQVERVSTSCLRFSILPTKETAGWWWGGGGVGRNGPPYISVT